MNATALPSPASTLSLPDIPSRVLVADDEYLVAVELTSWLAAAGFTVVGPVGTGREAVRLAREALPDMALLDIRMPDGNGLAAAAEIFEVLAVPVVILTACCDRECVEVAERAGVFGYLFKPSDPEQLRAALRIAWGRFKRYAAERHERGQLEQRLEERKLVERAKWVLVQRAGVAEPEALRLIRERARDERCRLIDVARRVLSADSGAGGQRPPNAEHG